MSKTPIIYRSDDPGAPDLSALYSESDERSLMYFHTVLKACLVNGYAGKPAAGWTMPYEQTVSGGNRFVLKNAAESGALLYEGGSYSGGAASDGDTLWCCSDVIDMDSPVNAWSWNVKYADRNSQSNATVFHNTGLRYKYGADSWVVIANENTCIVVMGKDATDFNTSDIDAPSFYSTTLIFGVMHDGFGGVSSPAAGNFYVAGGANGGYGSELNTFPGFKETLLTSIQDIVGIAKVEPHNYMFNAPVYYESFSHLDVWAPAPVLCMQWGPSGPLGNRKERLYMGVVLPAIKRLLVNFLDYNSMNIFMRTRDFNYGKRFTYSNSDWVVFKDRTDVCTVVNLDSAEWG